MIINIIYVNDLVITKWPLERMAWDTYYYTRQLMKVIMITMLH